MELLSLTVFVMLMYQQLMPCKAVQGEVLHSFVFCPAKWLNTNKSHLPVTDAIQYHLIYVCHRPVSLQYLQAYVMKMTSDPSASQYAQYCMNNLRLRISPRRLPPSSTEIAVSKAAEALV